MPFRSKTQPLFLRGKRLKLKPLTPSDFGSWQKVRSENESWLIPWEPSSLVNSHNDSSSFNFRCKAWEDEKSKGTGYQFGIFLPEGGDAADSAASNAADSDEFAGEVNISGVQRGVLQCCSVGYWIDEKHAGKGLVPEAVGLVIKFAFEELKLHRVQIAIIPRNAPSLRVVEKLKLREEGLAQRYLEINNVWEDHIIFAITAEEWEERKGEILNF